MLNLNSLALAGIAALSLATAANAEDTSRWFVHAGPAEMMLAPKATVTAGGQPPAKAAAMWGVMK